MQCWSYWEKAWQITLGNQNKTWRITSVDSYSFVEFRQRKLEFVSKFNVVDSPYTSCFPLIRHEKDTFSKHAQNRYGEIHNNFSALLPKNDGNTYDESRAKQ